MPITVQDILDIIEEIAPTELAEDWDNVGLMVGKPSAAVEAIMIGLDPTISLIEQAHANGANLVVTHHPSIFHPLKTINLESPAGLFFEQAIRNDISVIGCHTNLDSAEEGINSSLAHKLGLEAPVPLLPHPVHKNCGLGRIGSYADPVSPETFLDSLREACSPPWLLATPNRPPAIKRVAVCGGSCSELAATALEQGAQVFVTSEVKHSVARWAEQAGLWLIDAGHFATENQGLTVLKKRLTAAVSHRSEKTGVEVTMEQYSPLLLA